MGFLGLIKARISGWYQSWCFVGHHVPPYGLYAMFAILARDVNPVQSSCS